MDRFSIRIKLKDANATQQLAMAMAGSPRAGDVLLLSGQVGSGKTHFARSLIQARLAAAGLSEDVPSPTYTIVQTYQDGKAEIWHADLYRLSETSEAYELGLFDAFQDAICLVEWPEILGRLAPEAALRIIFRQGDSDDQRIVEIDGDAEYWKKLFAVIEVSYDF